MRWLTRWHRTLTPSLTTEALVAQALTPLTPQLAALTALLPQALVAQTLLPLLHRLVAFCWDLPASAVHHHSRPFGLLTHSMEVAQHALRAFSQSSLWWATVPDPAQLRTALPVASPPRPPSRPRMNSTLTLITPDKAQALLALCYQGQRPLRQHHVRFLRHLMRTGHWRQGAEIHCARVEGERFLVNGQHTLTALVQEGLAAWLTVVEIDVPTLAAIGRLYEAFDRNMTRSLDDIYQSDPEIGRYGWTTKQLKAMSGAVALLATGFAQDAPFADIVLTLRDPFVRAELLRDWSREATETFGAMQGQLRRYLLRSGVLSVLLATYRYVPQQAAQFWPAVCQDSGLTEGMPARALVHFLLTTPSRALGAPAYARHVASAWNACYEGHPLRTLVPRAGANPIRIAGTPHDGTATLHYIDPVGLVQHTPAPAPRPAA